MTETVVHVTTLDQWKSVLDVWFEQGYSWYSGDQKHMKNYFKDGKRELLLNKDNNILLPKSGKREPITYSDFMEQQKEENNMETYYVTQAQYDLIEDLKNESINRVDYLLTSPNKVYKTFNYLHVKESNVILRYLGGDNTIEFKVKEQLYRLWLIDNDDDKVYMKFGIAGTPTYTSHEDDAFIATLEEIKKWQTPAWEIENADENWWP